MTSPESGRLIHSQVAGTISAAVASERNRRRDSTYATCLVKVISKVLWCKSILTAVGQPKRDSLWDSQLVKVVQQRRHAVKLPGSVDRTRRGVQNRLKAVYLTCRKASQRHSTIVQP